MTRIVRRIGLFVLAAFLLAPAALAQGNQQGQQPAPAPDVEVSDAELETVASIYLEIATLQQTYRPKMQQAQNQQEAMKLRQEFQQKVTQKIEAEEDITPQRFGTIMRAAQADTTLQKRIGAAIESARSEESGGN